MKLIKKYRMISTIILLILFATISYFMYNNSINNTLDMKRVPVVVNTLEGGSIITEDDIQYMDVPNNVIVSGVYLSEEELVGKIVDYSGSLVAGSLFYRELIKVTDEVKSVEFYNLEQGEVAVSLEVDESTTYAHSIQVGQSIDLYFSGTGVENEESKEKVIYGELVKQAKVLAIYSGNKEGYSEDSEAYLVVALSYADADLVGRAKEFGAVFPMVSYDAIHNIAESENYYDLDRMRDAIYQRTIDITLYEVDDEVQ